MIGGEMFRLNGTVINQMKNHPLAESRFFKPSLSPVGTAGDFTL